jgi:hypothetical protein
MTYDPAAAARDLGFALGNVIMRAEGDRIRAAALQAAHAAGRAERSGDGGAEAMREAAAKWHDEQANGWRHKMSLDTGMAAITAHHARCRDFAEVHEIAARLIRALPLPPRPQPTAADVEAQEIKVAQSIADAEAQWTGAMPPIGAEIKLQHRVCARAAIAAIASHHQPTPADTNPATRAIHEIHEFVTSPDRLTAWDEWRRYIAQGGGGLWPRDALESWLSYIEQTCDEALVALGQGQRGVAADAETKTTAVEAATIAACKKIAQDDPDLGECVYPDCTCSGRDAMIAGIEAYEAAVARRPQSAAPDVETLYLAGVSDTDMRAGLAIHQISHGITLATAIYFARAAIAAIATRQATLADVPAPELEAVERELAWALGGIIGEDNKAPILSFLTRLASTEGRTTTQEPGDGG